MHGSGTKVRHRIARRLILGRSGGLDLTRVRVVPKSLRMPLLRDGTDPVAELGRLRADQPFARLTTFFGRTIWLASGTEEVRALLADGTSFSNDVRPLVGVDGANAHGVGGLGFTDPPDHTRLRRILTPEFTMRRLDRLRPLIDGIVARQLEVVQAAGPVADLVPSFAFPIPFLVICDLLGLPQEEREEFRLMGAARFDLTSGGMGAFGAASVSRDFFLEVVRRQRVEPGDGLIGAILTELGDDIDDETLSGLADGVFLGGFETTASTLALGTLVLLQSPEGRAAMLAGPESAARVVEELLRYLTVVQVAFPRFARHDLTIHGKRVAAGDVVMASLSGANRDRRLGPGMDEFDPHRAPVAHVAFGHGFHRCVGAELARMELRAAYPALLRRFPDLSLAVAPADLQFRDLSLVFGVESLPVRLGDPAR